MVQQAPLLWAHSSRVGAPQASGVHRCWLALGLTAAVGDSSGSRLERQPRLHGGLCACTTSRVQIVVKFHAGSPSQLSWSCARRWPACLVVNAAVLLCGPCCWCASQVAWIEHNHRQADLGEVLVHCGWYFGGRDGLLLWWSEPAWITVDVPRTCIAILWIAYTLNSSCCGFLGLELFAGGS